MKTMGFPISHKENERRRAICPIDIKKVSRPDLLFFEHGYGDVLGYSDKDFYDLGCHVCSREECIEKDIICDPKIGDAEYLSSLKEGQTIFGWIHATQNYDITQSIIDRKLTAIAWEKMFEERRHIFWRNNELAGEAAVIHAFQCYGKMPYETEVAVIGNGNTARGALRILHMLGARTRQYDRKLEKLFRQEMTQFDVIINCVLWDVRRKDHIVFLDDLKKLKSGAMIIDVSCDRHGAIESSEPTTIEKPVFVIDGILHYAVDHTPSLFYKTFSSNNSSIIYPYIDCLINGINNVVLSDATIVQDGIIIDKEIALYQNRFN